MTIEEVIAGLREEAPTDPVREAYANELFQEAIWISSNVTILPGITVGNWAVVAEGAMVTKDIPSLTVVGGVPTKVIKKIQKQEDEI